MINRRFWLGLTISVLFLGLLFWLWQIDLPELMTQLRKANYLYLIPGVALYFAIAVVFRTVRWRLLLAPMKRIGTGRLFPVVIVGYMANNILPVRMGEIVRSYYLGQREDVSKSATLATIAVERIMDGVVLLFLLAAVSPFLPLGLIEGVAEDTGIPWQIMVAGTTIPFLGAMGLVWFTANHPRWLLVTVRWTTTPLPGRLQGMVREVIEKGIDGLEALKDSKRLSILFALSLPVWLGEVAMYYVIGHSFDLATQAPALGGAGMMIVAMIAVTAVSNLATALPVPGGIGPFELFATASLVVLGVEGEVAAAYAIVLHAALLIPITLAGFVYLWLGEDSLGKIVRISESRPAEQTLPRAEEAS